MNVFVKPQEQNRIYSSYALARKGRMKSKVISSASLRYIGVGSVRHCGSLRESNMCWTYFAPI